MKLLGRLKIDCAIGKGYTSKWEAYFNSPLTGIPMYILPFYILPPSVGKRMHMIRARFLLSEEFVKNNHHLVN